MIHFSPPLGQNIQLHVFVLDTDADLYFSLPRSVALPFPALQQSVLRWYFQMFGWAFIFLFYWFILELHWVAFPFPRLTYKIKVNSVIWLGREKFVSFNLRWILNWIIWRFCVTLKVANLLLMLSFLRWTSYDKSELI